MSKKDNNYTETIQYLLYKFPLYEYVNKNSVNILIFGYTSISEKFIDFAFEVAQVNGYKLCINVVSKESNAKEEYLSNRPAFCEFFNVDDNAVDDNYGTLLFSTSNFENLDDEISNMLLNDESKKYAYLFIGTEDDELNSQIAEMCAECRELLDSNFVINCVSNNSDYNESINYIRRDDSIKNDKDYNTLKSMAFNCHLVWNYSKLLDIRKLQREFLSNYNYIACLSYVISLKYKLASIGIDFFDASSPEKFDRLVKSKSVYEKKIIEDMVANEHKRWNVNMICRGFKTAKSMGDYVIGTKAKSNGYHPCLVRGTGLQELNSDEWKKRSHEKWDECKDKDLKALDELDRVSVLLHKEYTKQANKIRRDNIILKSDIDIINKLLEGYPKAKNAFDKYYICLQEINAGNSAKTSLYDHYYSALNKALNRIPIQQARIVRKRINTLSASFSAILESEKYIDYKQYDVDLINKIPFILTYRSNLHIGIPIDLTNISVSVNTAAFRIVESALIINPSRITYICEYENSDLRNLIKVLEYAIKSMDSHNLRSIVNICLLTNDPLSEQNEQAILSVSKRIHSVETIKNEKDFIEYAKKRHLQTFEFNRTRTSSIIERYNNCAKCNYKYNRDTNKFVSSNCAAVKYISFEPFLKISDIFEFKNSIDDYSFPDMQKDYKFFWSLYNNKEKDSNNDRNSEKIWKVTCDILSAQDSSNEIEIENIRDANIKKTYLIEKVCLDSIKKLCKQIKGANETISCQISLYSNNAYSVTISAPLRFQELILELLCNAHRLYDPNSINIRVHKGRAYLYYNSLYTNIISMSTIKSIIDPKNVAFADIESLLRRIEIQGYIRNLSVVESKGLSFSYSTHQIKEVMTSSGRILELYVYYKLLESGTFDDVATSVEIHWGDNDVENEFDIIATKGYKVIIIECKAQIVLLQEYYNKLSRLNSDYGLNSVPIIIADTLGIKKHLEENEKMIEIGNRVGIHTIYKKGDISNVGNTIASIIKNS